MKHNILLATIVALMTAVGAVALLYPTTAIAEDELVGPSAKIAQPVLEVNGCTLTLALATTDLKPGDPVHLLLTATNPTDEPVEFEVQAVATSAMSAPEDMMVRRMPMPQPSQIWQQTCPISLSAGQTTEIVLETTHLAEAGALMTLSLQAGEQVVAFNTVAVPPAEDAPVDPPADEPEGTTDESTVHL